VKTSNISKVAGAILALLLVPQAKAAVVEIGFDQLSKVFVSNSPSQELATGSYFAFGSFSSDTVARGITQANILSTLRNSENWFLSFEAAYVDSNDTSYKITNATAAIADNQYAYAVYINDSLTNVRNALNNAAVADAGISTQFGVFTYSNTNPALRAALPRDPGTFSDPSGFSTEIGLGTGYSNFTAVSGLGNVAAGRISLIPEPTSVSLLLLGLGYVAVARRKSV
jgi:hypothetical protein